MSAAKKKAPYQYPNKGTAAAKNSQENLRSAKIDVEKLLEKLQKRIIDNPTAAKKAAFLLSLWINNKKK